MMLRPRARRRAIDMKLVHNFLGKSDFSFSSLLFLGHGTQNLAQN